MSMIKGIDVVLHVRAQTSTDGFNRPVYTDTPITVKNVLVTPVGSEESISETNMTGRKSTYTLHIPKGDAHVWEHTDVEFMGARWRTVGFVQAYIGTMLPLCWDKTIKAVRYE